jgi:DNA-directed RNA polymerase subunit RPC12/RpoP
MPQDEHRWPCEQCGAQLRFAPGQTQLVCEHCGHAQTITDKAPRTRARALQELDLAKGLRDDLSSGEMVEVRTTSCPNCGAQAEITGATHATECPFCATPVVLDTGTQRHIKPQALVPFTLTHRLIVRPEAQLRGHTALKIIQEIIESTPLQLEQQTG